MAINPASTYAQQTAIKSLYDASKLANSSMQRIASGLRVNSAKDDTAAISLSSKLLAEIKGIQQGLLNIQQMQAALSVADETNSIIVNDLQSIRSFAVQSMNGTNSAHDREIFQIEVASLKSNADSLAQNASYNGLKLNDGSFTNKATQMSGLSSDQVSISISSSRISGLGEYYSLGTPHLKAGTAGNTAVSDVTSQTVVIAGNSSASINIGNGTSAKTVANSVNLATETTGVSGLASTQIKLDNLNNLASSKAISFKIGTTSISNSTVTSGNLSNLIANINAHTNITGVNAKTGASTGELILYNSDGTDILIDDFISTNTADSSVTLDVTSVDARSGNEVGSAITLTDTISGGSHQTTIDSVIAIGQVELSSHEAFSLTGHDANATKLIQNNTINTTFVSAVDVSTEVGASNAVKTIDAALNAVNEIKSNIGADINRLSSSANYLTKIEIPKSKAFSQIKDADFAKETLTLTKAQIMQDMASAMLAQANSRAVSMAKALL